MRNYETLLARIAAWLRPQGKLFVHIFAHRTYMYPFETQGEDNWMGRHFFTGGLMPAADTLRASSATCRLERQWLVDGTHYQRTANDWLRNQDRHHAEVTGTAAAGLRDPRRSCGCNAGACSGSPVRRPSVTPVGRNGSSPTTASCARADPGAWRRRQRPPAPRVPPAV